MASKCAIGVVCFLFVGCSASPQGDIFDLYDRMEAEEKKTGKGSHLLYEQEGKTFTGDGTVAQFGAEIHIKSSKGRTVRVWHDMAEDHYKRPPILAVGDRVEFRCKMIEKQGFGMVPKMESFTKK